MYIPKQKLAHEDKCIINIVVVKALMQLSCHPDSHITICYAAHPGRRPYFLSVPAPLTLVMWVVVVVLVVSDVIVCALISTPGSKSAPGST